MLEQNYLKLYESDYFTLGYRSEIVNGLNLELTSAYEFRKVLENTTDFTIINTSREYSDNIPDNSYLDPDQILCMLFATRIMHPLLQKLLISLSRSTGLMKERKIPAGSDWPTFSLTWEHGINDFWKTGEQVNHYDMIRAEVYKSHDIGAFSEFRWRVRAGGFLDNRKLTFYDFFHFNPQPIPCLSMIMRMPS